MEWADSDRLTEPESGRPAHLTTAIVVSLVLHGLIFACVLWLNVDDESDRRATPSTVRINLMPPIPQREAAEDIGQAPLPETSAVPRVVEAQPQQPGQDDRSSEPVPPGIAGNETPEATVELPAIAPAPVEQERPAVTVERPTGLTLRQTVRDLFEQQAVEEGRSSCTFVQQQNELLDCDSFSSPDYRAVLESPAYATFGPGQVVVSRARQSMGLIAGNAEQLRVGIRAVESDAVNGGYFNEELSQAIEVYSGSGNTRLERLVEQAHRNDRAYQQMRRIMNPR